MSADVEVHYPSCDWEKIEALTIRWNVPLERVITAITVRGLLECCALTEAPTPDLIQYWCEAAYTPIAELLPSIE